MLIVASITVGLVVGWKSFHWFYEDIYDFLNSWSKAGDYRSYGLLWTDRQRWSDAALASAKFTVYFALTVGSSLLAYFAGRKILGLS